MSQLILDDQLDVQQVVRPLRQWISLQVLHELRPGQLVYDERVPEILLTLKAPTFVTIDRGFWHPRWCHPNYCILYFALRDDQQQLLPGRLRSLMRRPEFRTRASRMGKLVCIRQEVIEYWEYNAAELKRIPWKHVRRRKS